jgi:hypothetical protein
LKFELIDGLMEPTHFNTVNIKMAGAQGAVLVAVILISIFGIGVSLAFSIASIVIGSQYMNSLCDMHTFIRLSTWLIVYGSVNLVGVLCATTVVIFLVTEHYLALGFNIGYLVLLGLFNLAWNIVGAVALFRDSMSCQSNSYSIWAMTLAVLIIQWIGMLVSCFKIRRPD